MKCKLGGGFAVFCSLSGTFVKVSCSEASLIRRRRWLANLAAF